MESYIKQMLECHKCCELTYRLDGIDPIVRPILHVVWEHQANFLQFELSRATKPNQELIRHPRILHCVLEIDAEPVLEGTENDNLAVTKLSDVAER